MCSVSVQKPHFIFFTVDHINGKRDIFYHFIRSGEEIPTLPSTDSYIKKMLFISINVRSHQKQ